MLSFCNFLSFVLRCDLSDTSNCVHVVEKTISKFGRMDVVINNAGILSRDNFEDVTIEEIDQCMQVNLKSTVKLSQVIIVQANLKIFSSFV